MESRRVVLLTRGFLDGVLDFQYKNPLSELRETFILNQIERKVYADQFRVDVLTDAAVVSGLHPDKKNYQALDDKIARYRNMELPYLVETSKINKENRLQSEAEIWTNILAQREKKKKK